MGEKFTVREKLNRYELAQETIGFMMAMRTNALYKAEKQTVPDAMEIEKLNGEVGKLQDELHDLRFSDDVAIQHVLDDYCPIAKAAHEKRRATA